MTVWQSLRTAGIRLFPLLAVLGGVAGVGISGGPVLQREMTLVLVYVVIVVGMYSFIGTSGVMSFGHISFVAIGAYTTALLTVPIGKKEVLLPDLPSALRELEVHPLVAILAASLLAAAFAAVIGIPLMRLRGIAAGLSLLATLIIVFTVAGQWETVTRGRLTMMGVPRGTNVTRSLVVACVAVVMAWTLFDRFLSQRRSI